MKITYNEKKLKVNESMIAHAEQKLNKLDRFFRADAESTVKFAQERGMFITEVTVCSAHMIFRAQEKSGDLPASFDGSVDAIERQIRKNKTRLEKKLRDGAFERSLQPQEHDEPEEDYSIIRTKRFNMKPMTTEEAILQMNLLGHKFYAFKNVEDESRFCVAYARDNGGYGVIESD